MPAEAMQTVHAPTGPRPATRPFGGLRPLGRGPVVAAKDGSGASRDAAPPSPALVSVEAPPRPAAAEDPFALDGLWVRWEGAPKPTQVSSAKWDSVFPPDRARVRTAAGRHYVQGRDPDESVALAVAEIEAEASLASWKKEAVGHYAALAQLFGVGDPSMDSAEASGPAADAARAVAPTARRSWQRILAAAAPMAEAFLFRTWKAAPGTCLVCAGRTGPDDRLFSALLRPGIKDAIHGKPCMELMGKIGPRFGALVVEEAIRLRDAATAAHGWPEPEPSVDPDDSSTWSIPDPPVPE